MRIVQYAYAKINWAIDVLGIRDDGYHEIDMLMQTIDLHDDIAFEPDDRLNLCCNVAGIPCDGRNLIIRAANALNEYCGTNHAAKITLYKRIPMRAGLGGGSADCAATLIALNRLWKLGIPMPRLMEIGGGLGKDVPFCMGRGAARVSGTGERLLRLKSGIRRHLLIVKPGAGLSTRDVYAKWDELKDSIPRVDIDKAQRALITGDLETLDGCAENALEPAAAALMPEISRIRNELVRLGAGFARMTGSGSAVYGVFSSASKAQSALAHLKYRAILTKSN